MRRFTAFILFIIILFISMTILGIYIKSKITGDSVNVVNITIDLYKYKYGQDKRENQPYKTIHLDKGNEIKEFTDLVSTLIEIPYDESRTFKENNSVIKISYKKSTFNDLFIDTYEVWYDNTNKTEIVMKKGYLYYQLPIDSSNVIYKMINSN